MLHVLLYPTYLTLVGHLTVTACLLASFAAASSTICERSGVLQHARRAARAGLQRRGHARFFWFASSPLVQAQALGRTRSQSYPVLPYSSTLASFVLLCVSLLYLPVASYLLLYLLLLALRPVDCKFKRTMRSGLFELITGVRFVGAPLANRDYEWLP